MNSLKPKALAYFQALKAKGVALITFNCPGCKAELQTEKNNTSKDWGTLSECIECSHMFYKVTQKFGGSVDTYLPKSYNAKTDIVRIVQKEHSHA